MEAKKGRKLYVGGNWKSNGDLKFAKEHIENVINKLEFSPEKMEVMIAPIFIHLPLAKELTKPNVIVAAQNISPFPKGAYTGEITAGQIKDLGLHCAIVGHSERRTHFLESDERVADKIVEAQKEGLDVVLCIGEKIEEREAGKTNEVCKRELEAVLTKKVDWSKIVIAYEPLWAIGTGKVATPEQAQEVHEYIRKWLKEAIGEEMGEKIRIIYGGSVDDKNCGNLIKKPDIDGFLVGGASLKPAFMTIVKTCNEAT